MYEGPEIGIYTKNPLYFLENEDVVRKIAGTIKKRVNIRSDSSILGPKEEAKKKILEIVPEEAGVTDVYFDESFNSVVIEARRPGAVIGPRGDVVKRIVKETGWMPHVLRAPVEKSEILKGIRYHMVRHGRERKKFLEKVGERIYREKKGGREWVRIEALGGFYQVGRSCVFFQTQDTKLLLDLGIDVASEDYLPYLEALTFPLNELDGIVISHAHLDHVGAVPLLYKWGYDGPLYCTPPTRDLMALLLLDYVEVLVKEGREPPFTERDVKNAISHCITRNYHEVTDISPDVKLTFYNAGHILGSATVHLHVGRGLHNMVYTGDIRFGFSRLLGPAEVNYPRVESMIIESTYGGRRDYHASRKESEEKLLQVIKETEEKGGCVLIPSFAVGRGQEIMLTLEEFYRRGELDLPVYIDGMIREAAAIHTAYVEYLKRSVQRRILSNDSPFESEIFQTVNSHSERKDIVNSGPCIIIAPSGALTGGPAVEYFQLMAEDPKNAVVLVGYQFEGSLGRKLQRGVKEIPVVRNGKVSGLKVNLRVESLSGFSGHSDRRELMAYIGHVSPTPKRIIVNHGDPEKIREFSEDIKRKFRIDTVAPRNLDGVRLR